MKNDLQKTLDSVVYVCVCVLSLGMFCVMRIVITKAIVFAEKQKGN